MRRLASAPLACVLMSFGLPTLACHHHSQPASTPSQGTADSVVGLVRLTGVEASPQVTLVRTDGRGTLTLAGPASLQRVNGLEIGVVGRATGARFVVDRFTVISANGVPATDGRLVADGATLYLVTADGARHPLVQPSPALRAHVGGRVWVSGPLDHEPVAYGIIE